MELIVDSAELSVVKELDELLTVAGVTTNPTFIARTGKSPDQVIADLVGYLRPDQKFFVQVVSTTCAGMLEEARAINLLRSKETYAKIPVTRDGLRAIKAAKKEGLNVLATGIHSAMQGFLAAQNGADYLAPYANRMCNYGDGIGQVIDLIQMLAVNGMDTKVMAASFKNVDQMRELIAAGIQAITVAPEVIDLAIDHPGTAAAVDAFSQNWRAAYGRDSLF